MEINYEKLHRMCLFTRLSESEITKISPCFEHVIFNKDDCIFTEGDEGDALYIVLSGRIEIRKTINKLKGSYKALATLTEGSFFGEMSLLTEEKRSADAFAVAPNTSLIKIEREKFLATMVSDPVVASKLFGCLIFTVSERLRATSLEAATLYETGRIISSTNDPKILSKEILTCMAMAVGAEKGQVIFFNDIVDCFEVAVAIDEIPIDYVINKETELAQFWLSISESEYCFSASFEPDLKKINMNCDSLVVVPVIADCQIADESCSKQLLAVILLSHSTLDYFNLSHFTLFDGVAKQMSQALLSSKLLQENESRRIYEQVYVTPDL